MKQNFFKKTGSTERAAPELHLFSTSPQEYSIIHLAAILLDKTSLELTYIVKA